MRMITPRIINTLKPESQWNMYSLMTIPENASEIQIRETKKAFMAGMVAMMTNMITISGEPSLTEDKQEEILKSWQQDLTKYIDTLRTKPDTN